MHSKALTIGHDALQTIHTANKVTTIFTTSSGLFLITDQQKMLFITTGPYRGPFTINIEGALPPIPPSEPSNLISLQDKGIHFESSDWFIVFSAETQIWRPATAFPKDQAIADLTERSKHLSIKLKALQAAAEGKQNQSSLEANNIKTYQLTKATVKNAIHSQNPEELLCALIDMIGRGSGLTPAGDDFLCGFLLANYCFREITIQNLAAITTNILDHAKNSTTSLSWNLLRCATQGSADERIMNCLAWLANGTSNIEKITEELLTYGSSSGLETMDGLITYLNPN